MEWKTGSRIGSLDQAKHKAGGGDKKVHPAHPSSDNKLNPEVIISNNVMFTVLVKLKDKTS